MGETGLTKAVITLYGIDKEGECSDAKEAKPQISGKDINNITREILNPSQGKQIGKGTEKKTEIEVQYNPASIKYSGSTTDKDFLKQHSRESIISAPPDGTIRTSFTLILEAVSNEDTSVQEKMELVMRFLQKSSKRKVMFKWGKLLSAEGELISFSGSFDRFNKKGLPLSGKMNITIQTDLSGSHT